MKMKTKRQAKVFVVANQKGGVGKSTTACHGGFYLGEKTVIDPDTNEERGAEVAFINAEIQRNSSNTMKKHHGVANVNALAFFQPELFEVVKTGPITHYEGGPFMADIGREQMGYFKQHIERISPEYDYIVIDTPPSAGVLQVSALMVADYVLSPIEMDAYSLDGVVDMLKTIMGVKQRYNPKLEFLGMLPSRLQNTSPRQRAALASLLMNYSKYVFGGVESGFKVSVRQAIPEALEEGVPVWRLKSSGAKDAGIEMLAIMQALDEKMGG
ncbi:MAG: ParA family protein [Janthinobacterium sp.]